MGEILCITGPSGAGKSITAKYLGGLLKVPVFSLGNYQREKFASHGEANEYHKKLGLRTVYFDLWPEYIKQIASIN